MTKSPGSERRWTRCARLLWTQRYQHTSLSQIQCHRRTRLALQSSARHHGPRAEFHAER